MQIVHVWRVSFGGFSVSVAVMLMVAFQVDNEVIYDICKNVQLRAMTLHALPRSRRCIHETVLLLYGEACEDLQDSQLTLRLASACALRLQVIWAALVRHLLWRQIRPVLLLGACPWKASM